MDRLRKYFDRDALAFLLVGGGAAGLYVLVSALVFDLGFLSFPVPDWVISGVIYALFVPLVYFAHRVFSFRSKVSHGRAFFRYLITQVLGVLVATGLSFLAYQVIGMTGIFGSVLIISLTSLFNYVVLRSWAFSPEEIKDNGANKL